jgi:hypothetical protein
MKASDILHGLADLLSGLEPKQIQPEQGVSLVQVSADNTDHSNNSGTTCYY